MFVKIVEIDRRNDKDHGWVEADRTVLYDVREVSYNIISYKEATEDVWAYYPFSELNPNEDVLQLFIVSKDGDFSQYINVQYAHVYFMNDHGETVDRLSVNTLV